MHNNGICVLHQDPIPLVRALGSLSPETYSSNCSGFFSRDPLGGGQSLGGIHCIDGTIVS